MASLPTEEGWYPDPTNNALERHFDGTAWTKEVRWPKLAVDPWAPKETVIPDLSTARRAEEIFNKPKEKEWVHPRVAAERESKLQNVSKKGGIKIPAGSWAYGGTNDPENLTRPLVDTTFGQSFGRVWKRWAMFDGRSSRSEFWWGYLAIIICSFIPCVGLVSWFPLLSSQVRRLHDTGRSGWWLLLGFLPVVIFAVLLFGVRLSGVANEENVLIILSAIYVVSLIPSIALLVMLAQPATVSGKKYDI